MVIGIKLRKATIPETDPTGRNLGEPGAKMDSGKPDYLTALEQFPRALAMVSEISTFGAETKGYGWNAWREVPNAQKRYSKAELRHMLAEALLDDESGLNHSAHRAWCALAVLELELGND